VPGGLSVIVPVYNEEELLVPNTERLLGYLEALGAPYEVIIASNGSTDRTVELGEELARAHRQVRFFHLPHKGVGAAFRGAVQRAGAEKLVSVDMDLSVEMRFIDIALEKLESFDIVVGSKQAGGQKRSLVRKLGSDTFIKLTRVLLGLPFSDYSMAAKAYRRGTVLPYLPLITGDSSYVIDIIFLATRDGAKAIEIPVRCEDWRPSRFSLVREGVWRFAHLFALRLRRRRTEARRDCCGRAG